MQLFDVYPLYDIEPVKGSGAYIFDKAGNKYLDFYGGHAVVSIGHSHPHFVRRIQSQLINLAFYSNSIQNPLQKEFAKKLGEISRCNDYNLFLCNSGAEAIENALKVASFQTGKSKVISFKRSFHGRTSAAVNITDKESIKAPINKGFESKIIELNDLNALENAFKTDNICAVVLEGIQGWGGIYEPTESFLKSVEKICKEHHAFLILDEIQSGYGRTGDFFAFQKSGIKPDIVTLAKGMGNGFPVAGIIVKNTIPAKHGMLGTTFGGNHLACAAGLAVLEVFEEESVLENVREVGQYLKDQLVSIPEVVSIRGRGLMLGLEMKHPIKELRKNLIFEEKVFTGSALNQNTLRLLPPLTINKNDVDLFISKFKNCIEQMAKNAAHSVS